jgi:hypothetical protein
MATWETPQVNNRSWKGAFFADGSKLRVQNILEWDRSGIGEAGTEPNAGGRQSWLAAVCCSDLAELGPFGPSSTVNAAPTSTFAGPGYPVLAE